MIIATFMATYNYKICDANGNETTKVPSTDLNSHSAHKPKDKVYIKYEKR